MTNAQATGRSLYIVATPIGNLEDISARAINILKTVDFILAEDTRHSRTLLTALGIKNSLRSLHAHNEAEKSQPLIEELLNGKSLALISDAGTPLISDPGYPLVQLARQHQIPVIPIPGPCALITALSAAGLPCDTFIFAGFLPAKPHARVHKLEQLKQQIQTIVVYESTHRILESIMDIGQVFGLNCPLVLAKELTKAHEHFVSASVSEVHDWLTEDLNRCKGEFVLIIPPRPEVKETHADEEMLRVLLTELPLKQAVSIACKLSQAHKNDLYDLALIIKNQQND